MAKIEYLIKAHGVIERGMFYNYLHELGYKEDDNMYTRERMINSPYPFAVCMKKKEILLVESATLCYLNQKAGRMKTVEGFMQIMKKNI